MPVKAAPPPAPTYSWTGCNANVGVGYGMYDIDHSTTGPGGPYDTGHDNGGRGWLGRVGGGCDYQFSSSFVIGAFADYDWANIHGRYSYNCPGACAGPATGLGGDLNESSAWSAGARLGYIVVPQLLTYVDGGYRAAHYDSATLGDLSGGTAFSVNLPSQTRSGWFLGGGTEYALGWWKGLFWRTEYRFATYGSRTVTTTCNVASGVGAGCAAGGAQAVDTSKAYEQTITSSLVWRFW
jgi:outer membrane immunogenic protein